MHFTAQAESNPNKLHISIYQNLLSPSWISQLVRRNINSNVATSTGNDPCWGDGIFFDEDVQCTETPYRAGEARPGPQLKTSVALSVY